MGVSTARFIGEVGTRGGADSKEFADPAVTRGNGGARASAVPESPDLQSEIPAVNTKPAANHSAR